MKNSFSLLAFFLVAFAVSEPRAQAAGARAYEKLEHCHYMPNAANDGDSFHVNHEGKEFIFRTYFADTPETAMDFPARVQEQSAYFGLKPEETLRIGKMAEQFTHTKLAGKPFTVFTRWQDAKGQSRLPRYYAHVVVDNQTLAELLVGNGLARVFGMPAEMPDGTSAKAFHAHLLALEAKAKSSHLGAWSVHGATKTPAAQTDSWSSFFQGKPSPSPAASASPVR